MRKQTRHRFVATNYNRDERHLPFLLYNFYFMRFAQRRKGKLAKTKIFLSLTSGVCFFALIFENYHTIPLAQNEIHLQLQLKSPIQDDGALVLYIRITARESSAIQLPSSSPIFLYCFIQITHPAFRSTSHPLHKAIHRTYESYTAFRYAPQRNPEYSWLQCDK